jgi:hypothetical protein
MHNLNLLNVLQNGVICIKSGKAFLSLNNYDNYDSYSDTEVLR